MAGYIGTTPVPQATQHRESFTATGGQTSFATAGYTPQFIDVYLNGVKLAPADFTATNGSDVVLASGATASDILEIVAYTPFEVANQTFTGTTTAANLTVTGAFTSQGIDDNANAVAITIDSSENVGIGTSSPSSKLHVSSPSNGAAAIVEAQGAYNARVRILSGNANSSFLEFADPDDSDVGEIVYEHSNNSMRFNTNASERMRITSSGSVGIGTSSPRTTLDFGIPTLSSTLSNSLTAYQVMLEAPSGTGNYAHNIGWSESTGSAVTVAAINAIDEGSASATGITFATGNNSSIAERMRIDSSGNVGIGMSSPTAVSGATALEITGTSGSEVIIGTSDTTATGNDLFGGLAFKSIDSNGTPPHYSGIKARAADTFGGANLEFYAGRSNYESNDPRFVIEGPQSVSGEAMRLDSSGNLLVGTTNKNIRDSSSEEGMVYRNGLTLDINTSAAPVIIMNRVGNSDGDIALFRKDGATVGSIGNVGNNVYYSGGSPLNFSTGLLMKGASASDTRVIVPSDDSGTELDTKVTLGRDVSRFKDLYLSGGVFLGGTGAANKLEDYEEGTWTPAFSGATSVTHDIQVGRYTKVGSLVHLEFTIGTTSLSGSQTIFISGLPFTQEIAHNQAATRGEFESIYLNYSNLSTARYGLSFSAGKLTIRQDNTGGGNSALAYSDVSHTGLFEIRGSITYRTAT